MSEVKVNKISPRTGTEIELGDSGDTIKTSGSLDTNNNRIITSSNRDLDLYPNGTGHVEIGGNTNPGTIQLNCESNSHGIKLQSPAHSAGQSYTLKFPTGNVTADKFLKVSSVSGSGATGVGQLSFDDAGGGSFTKIASADYSSAVSNFTYTNCFTSTYSVYKFYMYDIDMAANNSELRLNFLDSGGNTIGNWVQVSTENYVERDSSDGGIGTGTFGDGANNYIRFNHNDLSAATAEPSHLEMTIFTPYESQRTTMSFKFYLRADNGYNYLSDSTLCLLQNSTSIRSMKFLNDSGTNFANYKSTIYGLTR